MQGTLSRSLEARTGLLAVLVLLVVTAGVASALALEATGVATARAAAAPGTAPRDAPTAVPALATGPRPLTDADLVLGPAWEVPATAVDPVLVLAAPAAASAPSAAAEPPDPLCAGEGWQQRRGEAALATLRRPSDAAPFRLAFEPGRRGVIGLATLGEGRLQVFVRSCAELPAPLLAHVLAHELGHLVDAARLTDDDRRAWREARGIPASTPWYGCSACTDFATPAGDFAEVYAQWQTGASDNRSQLAGAPSAAALAALAARFF